MCVVRARVRGWNGGERRCASAGVDADVGAPRPRPYPTAAPTLGDVLVLMQRRGGSEATRVAAGRAVILADQGALEGEGRSSAAEGTREEL